MKNLVVIHLESISRQRLAAFARHLPHTLRLMGEARVYDHFHASATSTLMVMAYLFHANDFEYDTATEFEGMRANRNNPHRFAVLRDAGYHAYLICLNGFQQVRPVRLDAWSDVLGPVWGTHDFPTLVARFDELTDAPPFAVYVWDLITHIEHSLALAVHSDGLTGQVRRACAMAPTSDAGQLTQPCRDGSSTVEPLACAGRAQRYRVQPDRRRCEAFPHGGVVGRIDRRDHHAQPRFDRERVGRDAPALRDSDRVIDADEIDLTRKPGNRRPQLPGIERGP
jgi:hypothetical protein